MFQHPTIFKIFCDQDRYTHMWVIEELPLLKMSTNISGHPTGWSLLVDTKVFEEKRICQAAMFHIVDVFSPFDNKSPTSSNAS